MPPQLPPETLDLIVDNLSDEPTTLNACCALSKSWVTRTRRHLFHRIEFSSKIPIGLWTETFPDPSNSPAHYTRVLLLYGLTTIAAAGTHALPWVHSFNQIVELQVNTTVFLDYNDVSLASLRGLSPTLKSLSLSCASIPLSKLLNLICSFPLLQDLGLRLFFPTDDPAADGWEAPSNSPSLTGSLHLSGEIRSVTRQLLDLPNGLHLAKITMACRIELAESARDLLLKCSDTLESLDFSFYSSRRVPPLFDLSSVTKLKDVRFQLDLDELGFRWINTTLRTAKSTNLQKISIHSHLDLDAPIEQSVRQELQDLECLLLQLWTSRSIYPKVTFEKMIGGRGDLKDVVPNLLPELMSRGVVDMLGS